MSKIDNQLLNAEVHRLRAVIADQEAAITNLSAQVVTLQNAAGPREAKLALAIKYDTAKFQRIRELEAELAARNVPPRLNGAPPELRLVSAAAPPTP